ncbi:peptidyl-prolyl cis-trans isomerase [Congregibacter sp.]|uniref:peptidylprolyl isomerase n=1 Tax=Congregibacter sp. TaxID=2744308 RepID=UPI003F6B0BC8
MTERADSPKGKNVFKDPLLHFAVIGVAFFLGYFFLNGTESSTESIVVSTAQQEQLVASYSRVWRRPPNAEELKGLLDDWVREEIANREAMNLGLATNDLVVRRRLRQKYESFMDQIAASVEPTESELEAWYAEHADGYREDARYSLRQRFFSSDRRDDANADAAAALAQLDVNSPELTAELGDALAMPQHFENNRETELTNRFGQAFTERLPDLPIAQWSGPVPSAYGFHLVFIESADSQRQPPLEDVRDAVLRDWRAEQIDTARDALYAGLLKRYKVEIQTVPESADS